MTQYQDEIFSQLLEAIEAVGPARFVRGLAGTVEAYEMVASKSCHKLAHQINMLINKGWQPHGSLHLCDHVYSQAMVKRA
jgi:hypothetical protein